MRLIRVAILADSSRRAYNLSELLSDDHAIEVVHSTVAIDGDENAHAFADVIVAAALDVKTLEILPPPIVVLAKPGEQPHWPPPVCAWLPLNAEGAEVSACIHAAGCDLVTLTRDQARAWLPAELKRKATAESLTARELQVLRMIAAGLGNKEIASGLHISEHTAKSHVAQILAKLDAVSRAEAVAIGMKHGLVAV